MGASSDIDGARRFGDDVHEVRGVADAPLDLCVEACTRWDAVELLRRLHSLRTARTYMVQNGPGTWLVHARPHTRDDRLSAELDAVVDAWRLDRGLGPV